MTLYRPEVSIRSIKTENRQQNSTLGYRLQGFSWLSTITPAIRHEYTRKLDATPTSFQTRPCSCQKNNDRANRPLHDISFGRRRLGIAGMKYCGVFADAVKYLAATSLAQKARAWLNVTSHSSQWGWQPLRLAAKKLAEMPFANRHQMSGLRFNIISLRSLLLCDAITIRARRITPDWDTSSEVRLGETYTNTAHLRIKIYFREDGDGAFLQRFRIMEIMLQI